MVRPEPIDWSALLAHPEVMRLVELALAEDVGPGDVTTAAVFDAPQQVRGHVVARTPTVACGLPLAAAILRRFDAAAEVSLLLPEGAAVPAGGHLLQLRADVRAVLTAERTLLNFMMRLCAIAFASRRAVAQLPAGSTSQVFDTRKTVPGWRRLDKAAVRTGGAKNHRMGLFDAVLIKDNHVAAAGSVRRAVELARARVGRSMLVEVEIDRLDQLDEALAAAPDVILLDNFDDPSIAQAVRRGAGAVSLEASGGITDERVGRLAALGVDRISMGALTHSVQPADLSLELTT